MSAALVYDYTMPSKIALRKLRLAGGRCPLDNHPFQPVFGGWARCTCRDCGILGRRQGTSGPVELPPGYRYLLGEEFVPYGRLTNATSTRLNIM